MSVGRCNEYKEYNENWGINGHTVQFTSPCICVLQCRLVSGCRAKEMENWLCTIGLAVWEGLYVCFVYM